MARSYTEITAKCRMSPIRNCLRDISDIYSELRQAHTALYIYVQALHTVSSNVSHKGRFHGRHQMSMDLQDIID